MGLLTDQLRDWIGREVTYVAPEELGQASFRYFALAIGDDNPLYVDEEFARANGYPTVIAPPTLVCETNQYGNGSISDDGYIGHRWALPVTGCRVIRGGHEYEFGRPVLPTDRLHVTWRLRDITEKTSSRGTPLLLVESEAVLRNQDGDFLARNRETLVYRPVNRP
jgi:acyl dehydratase